VSETIRAGDDVVYQGEVWSVLVDIDNVYKFIYRGDSGHREVSVKDLELVH